MKNQNSETQFNVDPKIQLHLTFPRFNCNVPATCIWKGKCMLNTKREGKTFLHMHGAPHMKWSYSLLIFSRECAIRLSFLFREWKFSIEETVADCFKSSSDKSFLIRTGSAWSALMFFLGKTRLVCESTRSSLKSCHRINFLANHLEEFIICCPCTMSLSELVWRRFENTLRDTI